MVGATGFEPATSSTPWKRAIQTALRPELRRLYPKYPIHKRSNLRFLSLKHGKIYIIADVAQRIEHQSSELRVGGSNPFVRANSFTWILFLK